MDTEKSIAPRKEAASSNPEKGDRIEKDRLNGKNYSPHTYNPSGSSDFPQTSREDPTLVSDEDHSNKQSLRQKETRQSQRKGGATKDSKSSQSPSSHRVSATFIPRRHAENEDGHRQESGVSRKPTKGIDEATDGGTMSGQQQPISMETDKGDKVEKDKGNTVEDGDTSNFNLSDEGSAVRPTDSRTFERNRANSSRPSPLSQRPLPAQRPSSPLQDHHHGHVFPPKPTHRT